MLSIHLLSYISAHVLSYSVINQSVHISLSADAQNSTGAYVIIMIVFRRLLTTRLPGKAAACVIANNA